MDKNVYSTQKCVQTFYIMVGKIFGIRLNIFWDYLKVSSNFNDFSSTFFPIYFSIVRVITGYKCWPEEKNEKNVVFVWPPVHKKPLLKANAHHRSYKPARYVGHTVSIYF